MFAFLNQIVLVCLSDQQMALKGNQLWQEIEFIVFKGRTGNTCWLELAKYDLSLENNLIRLQSKLFSFFTGKFSSLTVIFQNQFFQLWRFLTWQCWNIQIWVSFFMAIFQGYIEILSRGTSAWDTLAFWWEGCVIFLKNFRRIWIFTPRCNIFPRGTFDIFSPSHISELSELWNWIVFAVEYDSKLHVFCESKKSTQITTKYAPNSFKCSKSKWHDLLLHVWILACP